MASLSSQWKQQSTPPFVILSASSASHIWALDAQGRPHFSNNQAQSFLPLAIPSSLPCVSISSSADGTVYACDLHHSVFKTQLVPAALLSSSFQPHSIAWTRVDNVSLVSVSIGSAHVAWAWDNFGIMYKYNVHAQLFEAVTHSLVPNNMGGVRQISVGVDGTTLAVTHTGHCLLYHAASGVFVELPAGLADDIHFAKVAVGNSANIVALDVSGRLYWLSHGKWLSVSDSGQDVPGSYLGLMLDEHAFGDVEIGADGFVVAVDLTGKVYTRPSIRPALLLRPPVITAVTISKSVSETGSAVGSEASLDRRVSPSMRPLKDVVLLSTHVQFANAQYDAENKTPYTATDVNFNVRNVGTNGIPTAAAVSRQMTLPTQRSKVPPALPKKSSSNGDSISTTSSVRPSLLTTTLLPSIQAVDSPVTPIQPAPPAPPPAAKPPASPAKPPVSREKAPSQVSKASEPRPATAQSTAQSTGRSWQLLGHVFSRLSIGTAANIWGIGMDNWIYYSTDGATAFYPITNMPVPNYLPVTISATADGGVFVSDTSGELYTLVENTPTSAVWTKIGSNIIEILAGSRDFAWCWGTTEQCYLYHPSDADKTLAFDSVAGQTPKAKGMDRLVSGVDGTTLGISEKGTIMRWNGSLDNMDFVPLYGVNAHEMARSFVQLDVGSMACMVATSEDGVVYRYFCGRWIPYEGSGFLAAIVGADGFLVAVDDQGRLHRWPGPFEPTFIPQFLGATQLYEYSTWHVPDKWQIVSKTAEGIPFCALECALDANGHLWALGIDRRLYISLDKSTFLLVPSPQSGLPLISIAASRAPNADNTIIVTVVDIEHMVYTIDSSEWTSALQANTLSDLTSDLWDVTDMRAVSVTVCNNALWGWDTFGQLKFKTLPEQSVCKVISTTLPAQYGINHIASGDHETLVGWNSDTGATKFWTGQLETMQFAELVNRSQYLGSIHVDVGSMACIVSVDKNGRLNRYYDGNWTLLDDTTGMCKAYISVDGTQIYALDKHQFLLRWSGVYDPIFVPSPSAALEPSTKAAREQQGWDELMPIAFAHVALASNNNVWGVAKADNRLHRSTDGGGSFVVTPSPGASTSPVRMVSAASDGTVYCIDAMCNVYRLGLDGLSWMYTGDSACFLRIGNRDIGWLSDTFKRWRLMQDQRQGFKTFEGCQPTIKNISELSVGADGETLGVGSGGEIWQWTRERNWVAFNKIGGGLMQADIGSGGIVVGVDMATNGVRLLQTGWVGEMGNQWHKILVAHDGNIYGLDKQGFLWKWLRGWTTLAQQQAEKPTLRQQAPDHATHTRVQSFPNMPTSTEALPASSKPHRQSFAVPRTEKEPSGVKKFFSRALRLDSWYVSLIYSNSCIDRCCGKLSSSSWISCLNIVEYCLCTSSHVVLTCIASSFLIRQ